MPSTRARSSTSPATGVRRRGSRWGYIQQYRAAILLLQFGATARCVAASARADPWESLSLLPDGARHQQPCPCGRATGIWTAQCGRNQPGRAPPQSSRRGHRSSQGASRATAPCSCCAASTSGTLLRPLLRPRRALAEHAWHAVDCGRVGPAAVLERHLAVVKEYCSCSRRSSATPCARIGLSALVQLCLVSPGDQYQIKPGLECAGCPDA